MPSALVVGSGPNGLAAALTLASAGLEVTVLEAADTPGGGIRSEEATIPGLLHDHCAGFHPFLTDSAFTRAFDLASAGLNLSQPPVQYAHPLDNGGAAVYRSLAETAAGLGADEDNYRRLFEPLVRQFSAVSDDFLQPLLHLPRHPLALAALGMRALWPATLLGRIFREEPARALFAGTAAHAFTKLSAPLSSAIGVSLSAAAHANGWPVAVGGSQTIAEALIALLERHGGRVVTGHEVTDFGELEQADVVLFDTGPRTLARIAGDRLPARSRSAYANFRHGPGAFQLALAVEGGLPFAYEPARRAGTVHLGGTMAQVADAEAMVASGRMPERPFVLIGQQYLADPMRRKGELVPVDCYAHVPAGYTGDASAAILAQLERYAPGTRERIVEITARPTGRIEAFNPNFVGGDIVTGRKSPSQLLLGPRMSANPYRTGAAGIYLCSAAVPPGPGAHGLCGYYAARTALADLERSPAHG
ncbi:NAD(P)/FAD-dependent oxidoreductase [Glutamicibacter sp. PS]|uniref:phytoene desaturase family protein n=1 Tax=Glutamicibacter sp. PS TaxID=3075634 RepID=UPI002852847D|nr:NAD(P)/FAD-dependent oxidoreductase [Glutamicibacter sp. PS]